jgi:4'-phosphopantetheinyl transferase
MVRIYLTTRVGRLTVENEKRYLEQLPPVIRAAVSRFKRWEDRQSSLLGKLLLRHALDFSTSYRMPSVLDNLEYTRSGKPFIKSMPDFSISHSGEVIILAVADSGNVGIDVEKIRDIRLDDFKRYIPELNQDIELDHYDRLRRFFSYWTFKEAVLKGVGSGLLSPLEQVKLCGDSALFQGRVWHLHHVDCGVGYCCHLATSVHGSCSTIEVVKF